MIATQARAPFVLATLALVGLCAFVVVDESVVDAPQPMETITLAPTTVHFVPGTAVIVPSDLVWVARLQIPRDHRAVIASVSTTAEPIDLAQHRVEAIGALVHGVEPEEGQIVLVTTGIIVAGEPPEPPTDDATIEIR